MSKIVQIPDSLIGKVLLLRLVYDSQALIGEVRFEQVGGRMFAFGKVPPGVVKGFDGATLAIAWEQVEQFYLFETVEDFRAAHREHKKGKEKPWFSWD